MKSNLIVLLELLLVLGIGLGFAIRELVVLRRDKRKAGEN